jgi:hypothetical protein
MIGAPGARRRADHRPPFAMSVIVLSHPFIFMLRRKKKSDPLVNVSRTSA